MKWFYQNNQLSLLIGTFIILLTTTPWCRGTVRGGIYQGLHKNSHKRTTMGYNLIYYFGSTFLHLGLLSILPQKPLSHHWTWISSTSKWKHPIHPLHIPLLNTAILLASEVTITWVHHSLLENNYNQGLQGLFFTILLEVYFNVLHGYEYLKESFTIADSIYGSTFL
jgi:cytochrome c oxidase subunit 3